MRSTYKPLNSIVFIYLQTLARVTAFVLVTLPALVLLPILVLTVLLPVFIPILLIVPVLELMFGSGLAKKEHIIFYWDKRSYSTF